MYRSLNAAPWSALPPERRGAVVGRFCKGCQEVYSQHAARHAGKPVHGRDLVSSPCAYEGRDFALEAGFWEPAVEVLEAPPQSAA
ncbi:MAG: hypothetical protein K8H90_04310 [Thermoanaerobaculia bacterium]|nr:hypothetical protein [Thermoanaerobaculia bacterium]